MAGPTQNTRHSSTLGRELLATAVPVLRAGRPAGAVRITQSVAAVDRAVRRAILGLASSGGVVLALGLIAGSLIAAPGGAADPPPRAGRAAGRRRATSTRARPVEGSTEQQSLARSFNEMTDPRRRASLRAQQDFVADASHQLRTR